MLGGRRAAALDGIQVILSTIPSAKGQGWKSVYVLNVVDGCMPSDLSTGSAAEIEEERRLLYVAMTRAKDNLHLLVPQRFYVHQQAGAGDRHVYGARSRFIPDELLHCFEAPAVNGSQGVLHSQEQQTQASHPVIDIKASLRRNWQ